MNAQKFWCVVVERPDNENDWNVTEVRGPFSDNTAAEQAAERVVNKHWPLGHVSIHRMADGWGTKGRLR